MRRTSAFNRLNTLGCALTLLLGVLTTANAQADASPQANVAVRLKVVSACTINHATTVDVRCTPDTPTPAIVQSSPALPAAAQTSTAQPDAQTGATRIDIVF